MEIVAVGLTTAYKNLTTADLKEIAIRTIQNFYFETRGIVPLVYIKVATEKDFILQSHYVQREKHS